MALSDLESAEELSPKDPQLLYELGTTYFYDKHYKKCLKTLKNSLANSPYETYIEDIYYHIGLCYSRTQKFEKSIFPFSRCIESSPNDIRYIHERAKSYQLIDLHEESIKDFNKVIKRNP